MCVCMCVDVCVCVDVCIPLTLFNSIFPTEQTCQAAHELEKLCQSLPSNIELFQQV